MKMQLYVVYDKIAEESGPVFEAKNDGVARRMFEQVTQKSGKPQEFTLLRLGNIDHSNQFMELNDLPLDITFKAEV